MKKLALLGVCFAIQGITGTSANADVMQVATFPPGQPYCREYTQTLTIGNETQNGYGTACLQPDGSWEIQKPANVVNSPDSTINYVVRENRVFVVPPRPYTVVVERTPRVVYKYPNTHHRHGRW